LGKETRFVGNAELFDFVVVPGVEKHLVAVALEQFPFGSHYGVLSSKLLVNSVYD